jgi:VanZ family protein
VKAAASRRTPKEAAPSNSKELEVSEATQQIRPVEKSRQHWLRRWWPAIVWAIVISTFSTSAFTAENTSRIIIPVLHWMLPRVSMDTLLVMHHYIRKCAHFTEYFILGLLLLRGIRGERRGVKLAWALVAICIVFCYASLDEFHQSFVPGRTPAFRDVMIDTSGGTAAQVLAALVALWGESRRQRSEVRG